MSYPVDQFALCVDTVGWHDDCYVLPAETIGTTRNNEAIVYQHSNGMDNNFKLHGDLKLWQTQISQLIESHHRLVFSIAVAFTGQILNLVKGEGGGFHISGTSSKGKSTALSLACGVWGEPKTFFQSWKATGNALENIAHMHNDGFLGLDEIGEANPKDIGDTVYMFGNGVGKGRMGRESRNKPRKRFDIAYLSTGEETFSAMMKQHGEISKLGQDIRLPDINLNDFEYGIFDRVDFAESSRKQAEILKDNIQKAYGVAGKAWLEYLTSDKQAITQTALKLYQQFAGKITPDQAQGHIARVASRFALVAVAGELATQAQITGWQKGRALEAVTSVFKTWLNNFEMVGDFEDRQILQQVRAFFEANGNSRFDTLIEGNKRANYGNHDHPDDQNADAKGIREKTMYRVGYVVKSQDRQTLRYLVFKEQFKQELCKGFDPKKVAKVLKTHGWLDCANGKTTKQERIPEAKNPVWLYVFNDTMQGYDIEKATNPYTNDQSIGTTIDI